MGRFGGASGPSKPLFFGLSNLYFILIDSALGREYTLIQESARFHFHVNELLTTKIPLLLVQ